jgi:hypothetical protein
MGCVVDDLAGDAEHRLWRRDVTAVLDALELLGAVHLGERASTGTATTTTGSPSWPGATTRTHLVSLTPIGLWAVREMLVEQGVHAPLVGELADEEIEYVCVRASRLRREVARGRAGRLGGGPPPARRGQEVLRYLQRAEDEEHRGLAVFRAVAGRHTTPRAGPPPPRPPLRRPGALEPVAGGPTRWECDVRTRGA